MTQAQTDSKHIVDSMHQMCPMYARERHVWSDLESDLHSKYYHNWLDGSTEFCVEGAIRDIAALIESQAAGGQPQLTITEQMAMMVARLKDISTFLTTKKELIVIEERKLSLESCATTAFSIAQQLDVLRLALLSDP